MVVSRQWLPYTYFYVILYLKYFDLYYIFSFFGAFFYIIKILKHGHNNKTFIRTTNSNFGFSKPELELYFKHSSFQRLWRQSSVNIDTTVEAKRFIPVKPSKELWSSTSRVSIFGFRGYDAFFYFVSSIRFLCLWGPHILLDTYHRPRNNTEYPLTLENWQNYRVKKKSFKK